MLPLQQRICKCVQRAHAPQRSRDHWSFSPDRSNHTHLKNGTEEQRANTHLAGAANPADGGMNAPPALAPAPEDTFPSEGDGKGLDITRFESAVWSRKRKPLTSN